MNNAKPIVVGIDFSPASPSVLRHAAGIATTADVPLIVVHVIDASRMSHWLKGKQKQTGTEKLHEIARRKLADLVATEPMAAGAELIISSGHPSEAMQAVIDEKDAGLLVIAANDLTKKRLGLTASRCVRVAHCDVLVLRDWQDQRFTRIMACVDLSMNSHKVIERGIDAAEYCEATLDVAHVLFPPESDMWGEAVESESSKEEFAEHSRAHAHSALKKALQPFEERLKKITVETTLLESNSPSVRLTHYTEESGADLVVLGTRGHSKLGAHFLGTNTERLLQDAPVSVLAVRV